MQWNSTHPSEDGLFEVVFVCTGNRARSPLAEALFRRCTPGLRTGSESFGTLDTDGLPPLPEALEAARRLGVDLSGHRARSLRHAELETADLVVGFEPHHVAAAVVEGRANISRTFLLGELVTLLDVPPTSDDPHERAGSALAAADAMRVRSRPNADLALADPLGKPADVVARIALEVDVLVKRLVEGLFGIAPAGSRS